MDALNEARVRLARFPVLGAALLALSLVGCARQPEPCAPASPSPVGAALSAAPPPAEEKPVPAAPLATWSDGTARQAILDFVDKVTDPLGTSFVPEAERIAVFDNDGTLWSEQPIYVQFAFALDRVKELAPQHPEWKTMQPFKAALAGDLQGIFATGEKGLTKLLMATHAGMSADEFESTVRTWLKTAKHPRYGKLYTELTYAPMVELLGYLRERGFKTFIVSGGGDAFMRPWTAAAYGIPPEQVVGSRLKAKLKEGPAGSLIERVPEFEFIDDGPGKPVGIYYAIGRHPIFASGNSDGDLQMLEWTMSGKGARFALLIHHTDDVRETAYDRASPIGKLDKALDAADKARAAGRPWVVVDMKKDWKKVFSFDPLTEPASAPPEPAPGAPAPLQPVPTTPVAANAGGAGPSTAKPSAAAPGAAQRTAANSSATEPAALSPAP